MVGTLGPRMDQGLRFGSPGGQRTRVLWSMAAHRATRAFLGVVFLGGGLAHGLAADIQTSNDKLCAFKLEGAIASGDHDRLADLFAHSHLDPLDERTTTLCLKSFGGLYDEALKISELLYSHGVSTVVADGSECFSACALIFTAGVLPDRVNPHRKLSAGGILGFHAPYFSLTEGKYSKEQMEGAAQDMRTAILALMRLASRQTWLSGGDFLKKSLIARILEKGPQEVFFVKTIAEAARWDIEIYDAAESFPEPNNIDGIKNLCNNFHYANMDEPVPPTPRDLSLKVEQYASKFHKDDVRILVLDSRATDTVCEVYPRTTKVDPQVQFFVCSYDYWTHKSFGDCRRYKTAPFFGIFVPSFFTLAPATVLKRFH